MKRVIAIILVLSMLCAFSEKTQADWVDDMVGNFEFIGPSTFEGQQRGYVGFGSVGVRYPVKSDYLFSIEPPRIRTGCGGIDIYLGSFSYLNPEYLVQKLERILQTAPAMAFNLALSTLCEKCQTILSTMEAIANAFNSLQLDECQASKALVAYTMNTLTGGQNEKLANEADRATQVYKDMASNFWQGITDAFKSNNYKSKTTVSDRQEGCNANARALIDFDGLNSFVQYIFAKKNWGSIGGLELWRFVSAVAGDIRKEYKREGNTNKGIAYTVQPSCLDTKGLEGKTLSEVQLLKRENNFSCGNMSGRTIAEMVDSYYNAIKSKMTSKGTLNLNEKSFLDTIPAPAYRTVVNSVIANEPSVEFAVKKYMSQTYLIHVIRFALKEARKTIFDIERNMARLSEPETCQVIPELLSLKDALTRYTEQLTKLESSPVFQKAEEAALAELSHALDAAAAYVQYEKEIRDKFITMLLSVDTSKRGGRSR